jgi:hypothetical protein
MNTGWCVAYTTMFKVRTAPQLATERDYFILFSERNSSPGSTSVVSDFELNELF